MKTRSEEKAKNGTCLVLSPQTHLASSCASSVDEETFDNANKCDIHSRWNVSACAVLFIVTNCSRNVWETALWSSPRYCTRGKQK